MNMLDYVNHKPYPSGTALEHDTISVEGFKIQRAEWRAEKLRLELQFRTDALSELKLLGHPKADLIFQIAWQFGGADTTQKVFYIMTRLAELLK